MADQARGNLTPEQAQRAIARLLLEKVRADKYPSVTQMGMLEEMLPPSMQRDYLGVLLEKVAADRWPSPSLLRRVELFAARL